MRLRLRLRLGVGLALLSLTLTITLALTLTCALLETKRQKAKSGLPARPWKPWPSSVTTVSPEKTPAWGMTETTVGGS